MLIENLETEGKTPEQIQEAYESAYTTREAELKALANKNADGIFNGAAEKLKGLTGIEKNEKEQFSSYFERLGTEWLPEASKSKIQAAEEKVRLAEEKFSNHKGDETLKSELKKAQEELAKIPDLLSAKETEWKTRFDELEASSKSEKLNRSLIDSMPKFDDNVNKFELQAKKQNAIDRISETYELSYDEKGNLIGTKDYQKHLVSELLKADTELKDLILIDQGKGGGGQGGNNSGKTINIPEGTPKGASQKIIEAYIIANEGIEFLDDKFPVRFKELCKENNVL